MERRNIYLIGEINQDKVKYIYEESINCDKFNLHIHSEGGDFDAAIAIINLLKNKNVKAYGNSKIYSAAALIFISMKVRILYPNSFVLLHDISVSGVCGRSQDLNNEMKFLKEQYKIMKNIISRNSKLSDRSINNILTSEIYMNEYDCLEDGICDEIIR